MTKLDLSAAYQQLSLDGESQKLVTLNTHKGLFQCTSLPFRGASAPAKFQLTMDAILQGIPQVLCYIDDILVTGKAEADHLRKLEAVLKCLQDHGVHLKKDKCSFLQDSVEYLGHCMHQYSRGAYVTKGSQSHIEGTQASECSGVAIVPGSPKLHVLCKIHYKLVINPSSPQ